MRSIGTQWAIYIVVHLSRKDIELVDTRMNKREAAEGNDGQPEVPVAQPEENGFHAA